MDFTEKQVRSTYTYHGRIMTARVDDALLPDGRPCVREVCEHCAGVGVLPIDAERMVTLVRQYRYPFAELTLEIPAGKMDQGPENALECGIRELSEETGLQAEEMIPLGEIWPSPGFLEERVYLFCAKGLTAGAVHPDDDEFVEIVRMPFDEVCERIAAGEIRDAKTVAAVGKAVMMGL